jgi:hypothetical protein
VISYFDHAFGFSQLDAAQTSASMRAAGFVCNDDDSVRHRGGQLNQFVYLTGTYLEMLTIIDDKQFQQDAFDYEKLFRCDDRPFGIVARSENVAAVRDAWQSLDVSVPDVEYHCPAGSLVPQWSVLRVPSSVLPGAVAMVLAYLGPRGPCRLRYGDNGIFAVAGFDFYSLAPQDDCLRWAAALAPVFSHIVVDQTSIFVGPQRLRWLAPVEGEKPVRAISNSLNAVRLLCLSLPRAIESLLAGGFTVLPVSSTQCLAHHAGLGQCYVVESCSAPNQFVEFVNRQRGF